MTWGYILVAIEAGDFGEFSRLTGRNGGYAEIRRRGARDSSGCADAREAAETRAPPARLRCDGRIRRRQCDSASRPILHCVRDTANSFSGRLGGASAGVSPDNPDDPRRRYPGSPRGPRQWPGFAPCNFKLERVCISARYGPARGRLGAESGWFICNRASRAAGIAHLRTPPPARP